MEAGLRAFFGGIGFILATPRIWPMAAIPVLFMLLIGCGLSGLVIWGASEMSHWLVGDPEGMWGQSGRWLLTTFFVLIGLTLAMLGSIGLAQPLSGFALEEIVRSQERALTGDSRSSVTFWLAMLISLKITMLTLSLGTVVFSLLWAVSFFFPPASLITIPLNFLIGGWLLAWNFLDYPLTLHGLGVQRRMGWCVRHFWAFTSFGLAWAFCLVVPGMFLLVLPMGVAGATRLALNPDPHPDDLF